MAIGHVITQFNTLSIAAKVGIGAAVLVLLLIVAGGTRSCVSSYKDRAADKKQAELQAESDAHRARADAAEAKAKELATRAAVAEVAVQAAGAKAEKIAERIKVEDAKLSEELERIGEPLADPCDRVKRICQRLAIKPADCACTASN